MFCCLLLIYQGKFQQTLAKQSVELEQERGQGAEMRRRLQQLNQTYMSTGAPPAAAPALHCTGLCCAAPPAPAAGAIAEQLRLPCPRCAGDQLRSQITSQAAELEASKSAVKELSSGSEVLRLEMGQVKQTLAIKDQSLGKAEETAEEMRRRLQQLNQTYLASGARRAAPCAPCTCSTCCLRSPAQASSRALTLPRPALPAGDKLRGELASTKAELEAQLAAKEAALEAERSAKLHKLTHLESSNEVLRLGQGKLQQTLAKQNVELDQERGQAAEMRRRLQQLNQTYLVTGALPAACTLRRSARRPAAGLQCTAVIHLSAGPAC
jgi:hypothetical protein